MKDDYKRVRFLSSLDSASRYDLSLVKDFFDDLPENTVFSDINFAIEKHNVVKYLCLDEAILLQVFSAEEIQRYRQLAENFEKETAIVFRSLNDDSLEQHIDYLIDTYFQAFWHLFSEYKVFENISNDCFTKVLNDSHRHLRCVLENRPLIVAYDEEIAAFMRSNPWTAKVLLSYYLEKHLSEQAKLFFPKGLSADDKVTILENYISGDDVNPNYLELIYKSNADPQQLPLPDPIKLSARKKHDAYVNKLFSEHSGFSYGVSVSFLENQADPIVIEDSEAVLTPHLSYNAKWIVENLDPATILNNFIYLFEYTDRRMRSNAPALSHELGVLEAFTGVKSKTEYVYGTTFRFKQMIRSAQMHGYTALLKLNNTTLESVFRWFFHEYIPQEFSISGFVFNPPSEPSTIVEKIRTLASEMDGALKQFRLFVRYKEIDRELLEISSEQTIYENILSLLPDKYYYPTELCRYAMGCLFSDQSMLGYIDHFEQKYETLFDLLTHEHVRLDDFEEYQISQIQWLADRNFLIVTDDLVSLDQSRTRILKDLYKNEVGCRLYSGRLMPIVDELQEQGYITFASTLFSVPEQKYLNYVLNRKYGNGLDLRNKYIHSSYPLNQKQQESDYNLLLQIMVLIIIKLNDEFCLYTDLLSYNTKEPTP